MSLERPEALSALQAASKWRPALQVRDWCSVVLLFPDVCVCACVRLAFSLRISVLIVP